MIKTILNYITIGLFIISITAYLGLLTKNTDDSKDCKLFFEDYRLMSDGQIRLYYQKQDDTCCHFAVNSDDKIIKECVNYG